MTARLMSRFIWLSLLGRVALVYGSAPLALTPCSSPASSLVFVRADGTIRSSSGAQCVTFVGASPMQLELQPCSQQLAAQQLWALNSSTSAIEGHPSAAAACLAFNTQGSTTAGPARAVSTWPCSDVEWNGAFHLSADGRVVANCTTPDACGAEPSYCVGAPIGRVLSLSTVVRYWTVETTRSSHLLDNESSIHTVAACVDFRAAVSSGWPAAAITWAFSWDALHALDGEYPAIRALVAGYVSAFGDEMTFIPGGYFAPMYSTEEQTNADIHDALAVISSVVGHGYRPQAIVAGYLGARTLAYLATVEGIHVAQATIFSQFDIDFGDGDGGSPYPYYPSQSHYLRAAQSASDLVDCVVLDGWTVDFLAARRSGFADGFNSRMGVGPIETIRDVGPERGFAEQLHATRQHFDTGFALNGMAFVTSIWEISLAQAVNSSYLAQWLSAVRAQWPDAQMLTHGDFGLRWRSAHVSNDFNYSFVEIGSGIAGSDADKELSFYVNRAFRLVLLRNLTDAGIGQVIDFTRYDLPAAEPANMTRSWNLMNEVNMKGSRGAMDAPRPLAALSEEDRSIIRVWLPGL
jgi:hypothetical protein